VRREGEERGRGERERREGEERGRGERYVDEIETVMRYGDIYLYAACLPHDLSPHLG
jgi:hypothetical protein